MRRTKASHPEKTLHLTDEHTTKEMNDTSHYIIFILVRRVVQCDEIRGEGFHKIWTQGDSWKHDNDRFTEITS